VVVDDPDGKASGRRRRRGSVPGKGNRRTNSANRLSARDRPDKTRRRDPTKPRGRVDQQSWLRRRRATGEEQRRLERTAEPGRTRRRAGDRVSRGERAIECLGDGRSSVSGRTRRSPLPSRATCSRSRSGSGPRGTTTEAAAPAPANGGSKGAVLSLQAQPEGARRRPPQAQPEGARQCPPTPTPPPASTTPHMPAGSGTPRTPRPSGPLARRAFGRGRGGLRC
jgi:hypothetical protein